LFPQARLWAIEQRQPSATPFRSASLGTALRWAAALPVIDAFEAQLGQVATLLRERAASIERMLASASALVPIGGSRRRGAGWSDQTSIFTFALRDPADPGRLLPVSELRLFHERLARRGVLLGQPVALGAFGGLRIAIGARDLLDDPNGEGLVRVHDALEEATASPGYFSGDH
jgi:hypothetical protein